MAAQRKFDLVLFGATGFTGGLVAEYLAGVARARPLAWALAGRNLDKLGAVRARLGLVGSSVPELVAADASDAQALARMVADTRVVITTVGPYGKYGEPLVKACAEGGADYVDLTGEPEFMDAMIERYHARAEQRRVKIVHACGFDSIPHDLGAYFALMKLRERMSERERQEAAVTIEAFVRANGSFSGGTWHSAIEIMSHAPARARAKRKAGPAPASDGRRASALPMRIHRERELELWALPMPTIDPEIVLRSAALLPEYGPDFRYGHFMALGSAAQVAGLVLGVSIVFALAQTPPTRALLRSVRSPGQGPSAKARSKAWFRVLFRARAGEHDVRCEVRGRDPGYGETAKMLAESALCLAFDAPRLPQHFGVVPSAAAFGEPLIERLQTAGIAFQQTA